MPDEKSACTFLNLSEEDVLDAMKSIDGYIDITPSDFKQIYQLAFEHAFQKRSTLIKAKEIMSSPVITLSQHHSVFEAIQMLLDHNIHGAPVINDTGKMVGIITSKDFTRILGMQPDASILHILKKCFDHPGCMIEKLKTMSLSDIMTSPVLQAHEDTSISEISSRFVEENISHIVICNHNSEPTGMISRNDLLTVLCG